jgi:hypothetical protein
MDSLINSLKTFSITNDQDAFEDSMNDLVDKLSKQTIKGDSSDEWRNLESNYNKLKYLKELISSFDILPQFFLNPLKVFMESIDSMTQYYLKEIDWYRNDYNITEETSKIHDYLEDSLNNNDPIYKLNSVLAAYSILVPIVEDFRRERCSEVVTDTIFLRTFKRRKMK